MVVNLRLLSENFLRVVWNAEAGVSAVATLSFVTSSMSATPEHETGGAADSVTGSQFC
ncbi:hypothetical protein Tco_0560420, partial [Tanacetum coccineum]